MHSDLTLCTNCERHIRSDESICPFCGNGHSGTTNNTTTTTAMSALLALSITVATTHCGPSFQYSNPPQTIIVVNQPTPTPPPVRQPPADPIIVIRNINPPAPIADPPPVEPPNPSPVLPPDTIRYAVPAYGVAPYIPPRDVAPMYGVAPPRLRR